MNPRRASQPRLAGIPVLAAMLVIGCTPTPTPAPTPASPAPVSTTTAPQSNAVGLPTAVATTAPAWTSAGRMAETRVGHTTTLLQDGRVLVAGGFADGNANDVRASAEVYDPATGSWSPSTPMLHARAGHIAVLLTDGTVLVAGGGTTPTDTLDTAELYNPTTNAWTATGSLRAPLASAAATLLLDGRVLLVGGDSHGDAQLTAELYDPRTRKWTFTGEMDTPRSGPTATRLWTGQVLVAGGANGTTPLASAELYDPQTGSWSAAGTMAEPRVAQAAAILVDGRVLVAGGLRGGMDGNLVPDDILSSAEIFDPAAGAWSETAPMAAARFQFTMTTLVDGSVLAAVGDHLGNGPVPGAERFHVAGVWTDAGGMLEPRAAQTATLLPDGDVLVVGGEGPGARGLSSAELFHGPGVALGTLADGGTMYPGRYRTKLDPGMTITIDHEVDLDCAAGYRCRGDIDVNLPQWVAFEFGNVHGSELDIDRLDKVYAHGDGGQLIDIPDNLVSWFKGLSGQHLLSDPVATTVGGLPATRFDVRPDKVLLFGLTGLPDPDKFGINGGANVRALVTLVRVDSHLVVIAETLGPDNTAGDFEAAVRGLDPIVASIAWH